MDWVEMIDPIDNARAKLATYNKARYDAKVSEDEYMILADILADAVKLLLDEIDRAIDEGDWT